MVFRMVPTPASLVVMCRVLKNTRFWVLGEVKENYQAGWVLGNFQLLKNMAEYAGYWVIAGYISNCYPFLLVRDSVPGTGSQHPE